MAVRVSLGASRRRLVRQLLTESVVTAALGGVLGLWLAVLGCRLLEGFFGYQIPDMRLTLDWRVVSVSAILSVLTGIVFGMAPAWHATRSDPATALRGRSYGGLSAVAVQVALSAVLLICAGLLFQSMRAVLVRVAADETKNEERRTKNGERRTGKASNFGCPLLPFSCSAFRDLPPATSNRSTCA